MANKPAAKPASKPADKKEPAPVVIPAGTEAVKPEDIQPLDTGTQRAYQTSPEPGQREMLTKDEAQSKGFHWAESPEEKAAASKKKKR